MLKEERQQNILELLRRDSKIIARELSETWQVSEDTIRRDLNEMAAMNLLHRVHGGALPKSPTEISYRSRERESNNAKSAIATKCVGLLRNDQVILIDSGTTALRVAEALPPDFRATVITNSLPVLEALSAHSHIEVIGVGGRLFKEARCLLGVEAVAGISGVYADVCILGLNGIHPEIGLGVLDYESVALKTAMLHHARQVIAVAASDKIGTVASFIFGQITSLTHLVTDTGASEEALKPYRDAGVLVLTAEGNT